MRKVGIDFLLFALAPFLVALICGIGLVGGITDSEAFVPVYLIGLIIALGTIAMYVVAALLRTVRWLVTTVR